MADPQKERDDRLRRMNAPKETRIDEDSSFVPVQTIPGARTTTTETRTERTMREDDRPLTEKIGDTLRGAKEEVKETVTPDRPETDRTRMERRDERLVGGTTMTRPGVEDTTRAKDWEDIKHPGMIPRSEDPYGTRPVSELTPPTEVRDKADLAAMRMMEREKADREKMDRDRIMSTATTDAAAARAAMASKETTTTKETTRIEPAAGERTIRQGAAVDTPPTRPVVTPAPVVTPPVTERPMTGTVVPPGTSRVMPMKPYGTVDERARMHAEDPSVHPDWETQPQINAPQDVGIPTAEGQADAARIRAGRRRSDEAEEPRLDRRGGDVDVPMASGARRTDTRTTTERRMGTDTRDDRSITEKIKDKTRDVKEDVDRKI